MMIQVTAFAVSPKDNTVNLSSSDEQCLSWCYITFSIFPQVIGTVYPNIPLSSANLH